MTQKSKPADVELEDNPGHPETVGDVLDIVECFGPKNKLHISDEMTSNDQICYR